jgi:hypothetical protein
VALFECFACAAGERLNSVGDKYLFLSFLHLPFSDFFFTHSFPLFQTGLQERDSRGNAKYLETPTCREVHNNERSSNREIRIVSHEILKLHSHKKLFNFSFITNILTFYFILKQILF